MKFLLETDRSKKEVAHGEMTYRISEKDVDGGMLPQIEIYLALDKFYTEIYKITCEIGVLDQTKLLSISGGTKDNVVVYELVTPHFSLNPDCIDKLLITNQE